MPSLLVAAACGTALLMSLGLAVAGVAKAALAVGSSPGTDTNLGWSDRHNGVLGAVETKALGPMVESGVVPEVVVTAPRIERPAEQMPEVVVRAKRTRHPLLALEPGPVARVAF